MPREDLIDGIEVSMGGTKWTIPPLTLKQIRKHEGQLRALESAAGGNPLVMADVALDVIHAAMSRNYPELRREELDDLIDLGNLLPAVNAVLGVSGLLPSGEAGTGSRQPGATSMD